MSLDNITSQIEQLSIIDNKPSLKPLFKWSGGKHDELNNIVKHIPDNYDRYVEPFVGGGSLFFHLYPIDKNPVINDIHNELIMFYKKMKSNPHDIYEFMEQHPNNEEEYYIVRDLPESAERFYYLRKTCYRGMLRYNTKQKFNIPYGRYKTCNFSQLEIPEYKKLLSKTKILNTDSKNGLNRSVFKI
jgi:DNA adenine methylase